MRLETSARKPAGGDDNMIPLINVVFLMLVFFMVAGHIERSDPVEVAPPQSINQKEAAREQITLLVAADGRTWLDHATVSVEQLTEQLTARFTDQPELQLTIKVAAQLPVEQLQQVLKDVRASGITKVALLTQTREVPDA